MRIEPKCQEEKSSDGGDSMDRALVDCKTIALRWWPIGWAAWEFTIASLELPSTVLDEQDDKSRTYEPLYGGRLEKVTSVTCLKINLLRIYVRLYP